MKYPCLVPKRLCKTDIALVLYEEGLSESGGPLEAAELSLKCNYQDSAKMIMDTDQKLVQISGIALFPGDICPVLPVISGGEVTIFGKERTIMQALKARNPDGTVNYTELRLI
ncbi:hypothetical protein SAMN05443270_1472 [Lacrimispora sphenoides]|uniref:hypothetical protein n=1 Tax=Lacrimispora sphenoides TaxID=29370 RepID=UPI0008C70B3E|nr:hypothetical protein [Lacrimispora sphenoides]SET79900.1 hypothetical protein SAMN05443270_1472 [Lacrimispora sphenoides]